MAARGGGALLVTGHGVRSRPAEPAGIGAVHGDQARRGGARRVPLDHARALLGHQRHLRVPAGELPGTSSALAPTKKPG